MFFFILIGQLKVVKLLIENGVDINYKNDTYQFAALHLATNQGI